VATLATTPNAIRPTIETFPHDVASKWARPLHTLPIAGDFPRLAKVTTIYVGPERKDISHLPISDEDRSIHVSSPSLEDIIYETLIKLAIYLHDPTTLQSTKDHFWEHHKGDMEGEVARNFGMFLNGCLHDGDNVGLVLKCINQAILAPAIIALKMAIAALQFKDYGNSWRVKVFICDDDVEVVHVRREQSFNPQQGEAMKFEFVWELSIHISLKNAPNNIDNGVDLSDESRTDSTRTNSTRIDSPRNDGTKTDTPRNDSIRTNSTRIDSATVVTPDKHITNVTLQIVEIAFGAKVPPENKEKVLGDMRRLTSSSCIVTTIA
jgi:hypothetical protein